MTRRTYVFLGGMNAMPMVYAQELKKNHDVLYYVDRPRSDTLSRPECHYPEITYPYPEWIIERVMLTQAVLPLFRTFFAKLLLLDIRSRTTNEELIIVLNGLFISLAPQFNKYGKVIALSHGADLMTWGNVANIQKIKSDYQNKSIYRFMPEFLANKLIELSVKRQWQGFLTADKVVYFPRGFGRENDALIDLLEASGAKYFPRFDVSFNQLSHADRSFKVRNGNLVIFSGLRFIMNDSADTGRLELSKGNGNMIIALAEFRKVCPALEIHFIDKGPDVEKAKSMCVELGLEDIVTWHKEMPFKELVALYLKSDICFDSVGESWMGAVGAHALWLGKPLIANISNQIRSGWFPQNCPILNAEQPKEILEILISLNSDSFREDISSKSKVFAENYFSPARVIGDVFEANRS